MTDTDLFQSIRSQSRLVDRVVEEIEQLILDGKLKPGMRLPPQRQLAQHTGVSRPVIREAVHILETKGILESKHGIGTIIRPFSNDQFTQGMSWLLRSHNISLDDLHQMRSILEVENARLAALNSTVEGVDSLRKILLEMDSVEDDARLFAGKDAEFHNALAQMTNNPLLVMMIGTVRELLQEVRLSVSRYPDLKASVMPDHYNILECVASGDAEGASQAMRVHLDHARLIQEHFLKQRDVIDQI